MTELMANTCLFSFRQPPHLSLILLLAAAAFCTDVCIAALSDLLVFQGRDRLAVELCFRDAACVCDV